MKKKTELKIRYEFLIGNYKYQKGAIKKTISSGERYISIPGTQRYEKEEVVEFDPTNVEHVNAKLNLVFRALQDIKIANYE